MARSWVGSNFRSIPTCWRWVPSSSDGRCRSSDSTAPLGRYYIDPDSDQSAGGHLRFCRSTSHPVPLSEAETRVPFISTSPSVPLSENRRGGDSAPPSRPAATIEKGSDRFLQCGHRHSICHDPHYFDPLGPNDIVPLGVSFGRTVVTVGRAVDLHSQE